jgi:hypothetical protein
MSAPAPPAFEKLAAEKKLCLNEMLA